MQLHTNATLFSADTFHSNKTNKDYHRVGLIVEGQACTMFVNDNDWPNFVAQPFFQRCLCSTQGHRSHCGLWNSVSRTKGVSATLPWGFMNPRRKRASNDKRNVGNVLCGWPSCRSDNGIADIVGCRCKHYKQGFS